MQDLTAIQDLVDIMITMSCKDKSNNCQESIMSSHKDHSHLEKIKEAIDKSDHLSDKDKSESIKHIEEWILEDKAEGTLYRELMELTSGMKPILAELGLI
jgi:hypothetical protein